MSITSISIQKSLYPLVDSLSNPRQFYYWPEPDVIWKKPVGGKSVAALPCALSSDDPSISITIDTPGTYTVSALQNGSPVMKLIPNLIVKASTDSNTAKLLVSRVPWVISGDIVWTLVNINSKKVTVSTVALELYFLNLSLPAFLSGGVPLALLRFPRLLQAWKTATEPSWPRFVVSQLFTDRRMTYENFKGMNKYTSWETDWLNTSSFDGIALDCWIDLWISDMNGLEDREDTKTQYAVNCYDLASIVQTISALGIDISKWRSKYMAPFGYLKPATLIGNTGPCNNPYYGRPGINPKPLCNPTDDTRSFLRSHMFLASDNSPGAFVYDACIGPQLGITTLSGYPAVAIDSLEPKIPQTLRGTLADIHDGQGVVALATSVCTYRLIESGYGKTTLIQNVMEEVGYSPNTVRQPYIGRVPATGTDAVVATFTINVAPNYPNGLPDVWTLNIFRFSHLHQVQAEFTRRRSAASSHGDDESLNANEWLNPNMATGGFRMFYDSAQFVLVVIESSRLRSEELGLVANKMKNLIQVLPGDLGDLFGLMKITGLEYPKQPITLNKFFRASLSIAKSTNDWWIGYAVQTSYGVCPWPLPFRDPSRYSR